MAPSWQIYTFKGEGHILSSITYIFPFEVGPFFWCGSAHFRYSSSRSWDGGLVDWSLKWSTRGRIPFLVFSREPTCVWVVEAIIRITNRLNERSEAFLRNAKVKIDSNFVAKWRSFPSISGAREAIGRIIISNHHSHSSSPLLRVEAINTEEIFCEFSRFTSRTRTEGKSDLWSMMQAWAFSIDLFISLLYFWLLVSLIIPQCQNLGQSSLPRSPHHRTTKQRQRKGRMRITSSIGMITLGLLSGLTTTSAANLRQMQVSRRKN